MMIALNNQSGFAVDEAWLSEALERVFRAEGRTPELSVALLSPEKMQELNRRYRGEDKVPDELSLSAEEGAGELLLCPSQIRKNAGEYGMSEKEAFARSLAHGLVHVLGRHHEDGPEAERAFRAKEEKYLDAIPF